jgi:hypothetical protein
MKTHDQAKAAMDNISQTNIRFVIVMMQSLIQLYHVLCRGSIVDVSWAVVQRSLGRLYLLCPRRLTYLSCQLAGFLDGGDRAVTLEGQADSTAGSGCTTVPAFQASSALSDKPKTINSLTGAQSGSASIVVHNLPAFLFAQESDLEPLFYPFGEVKEIRKRAPSSATQTRGNTISVLVTYSSVTGAREAKVVLHGQIYGDTPLIVESFPPFPNHEANRKPGPGHLSRSSLNPCASPFVFNTASALSAPPTCNFSGDFPDYFSKPKLSGLATPSNHFSLPNRAPQGYRSLPASRLPSRSNSTASWSARLHV